LPILDRLQAESRHSGLQVIAVSEDRAERVIVENFANKLNLRHLKLYWDPNGYVAFNDADNKRNAPFAI
jgi:hypothetical protein